MNIGITSGGRLNHKYLEIVKDLGAASIILTPEYDIQSALKDCRSIIFSGGGDISPEYFGKYQYDSSLLKNVDRRRDEFELGLAKAAFENSIPSLGICRGIQIMNVALGGDLLLDIDGHMQNTSRDMSSHTVITKNGSMLSRLLGAQLEVNSFHHQAVNKVSSKFNISAISEDGIIEGIEARDRVFVGVQWHPEWMAIGICKELFKLLV